jgi:hypothetical protein
MRRRTTKATGITKGGIKEVETDRSAALKRADAPNYTRLSSDAQNGDDGEAELPGGLDQEIRSEDERDANRTADASEARLLAALDRAMKIAPRTEQYLNKSEAAKLLGFSVRGVECCAASGFLTPHYKRAGRSKALMFETSEVEIFKEVLDWPLFETSEVETFKEKLDWPQTKRKLCQEFRQLMKNPDGLLVTRPRE